MRVAVNGTRLYFDVEGAGLVPDGPRMVARPTLIVLHGGPGMDHSNFKPDFTALADVAQIVYLDHRGQGRSDEDAPENLTLAQWGDDVRAFCEVLGIERPVVLGLSFGGMVAQSYATRHPDHPSKLILMSTAPRAVPDRVYDKFAELGGAQAREAAVRFLENPSDETVGDFMTLCLPTYNATPADPDMMARCAMRPALFEHFFGRDGEWMAFDLRSALSNVICPTLILHGDRDPITPIEDGEDIAAALPDSLVRFETFPGCGHGVHRDDPDRAFAVLREFIAA